MRVMGFVTTYIDILAVGGSRNKSDYFNFLLVGINRLIYFTVI